MKSTSADVVNEAILAVKDIGMNPIPVDRSIKSLGLNSLDEVEVMMLIEEKLNLEIDAAQFSQCQTVQDFISLIDGLR